MKSGKPDFPTGVIEGFYGKPWTNQERFMVFDWLQNCGLNTYVYAPKDDLKHRVAWREPYSASETRALRALIRGCKQRGLCFCYAIAPGLDIRFSSDSHQDALRAKLTQIITMGCDCLAILFDDIPANLAAPDRHKFGSAASAQAAIANHIYTWLNDQTTHPTLFFCPTVYCGAMARPNVTCSQYLRALGEKLATPIKVFWTGPEIISNEIPIDTISELAAVLRRPPVLWDNLYANDYDMRRLHMGPYAGRPQALKKEIGGVLLNPNCQCHANFVPVRCLASWLNPTPQINQRTAWKRALRQWLAEFSVCGSRKVQFDELRLLCDFFHLPSTPGRKAQQFLDDLRILIGKTPLQWGNELARFQRTCRIVLKSFDILMRIENRALLHALYAHLWEIKERALFLDAWTTWRKANPRSRTKFVSRDYSPAPSRGAVCARLDQIIRWIVEPQRGTDRTERSEF